VKTFLSLLLLLSLSAHAQSMLEPKSPEDDQAKINEYNQACQILDQLVVRKSFKVECYSNYNFFGPSGKGAVRTTGDIKIAEYNLLHPGTSKALFKDYNLVAKIMNQYDIVSGLELLGTVGHDEASNKSVLDFLRSSPKLLADLQALKTKTSSQEKIKEIDDKIEKLKKDTEKAYSLYRVPGYFKVLMALKKLDPSWSLILSPRGDSALQGSVEEMVGYFFRATAVSPAINPHCSEIKDEDGGLPVACIINLSEKYLDKDYTRYFARRPFMVSFKKGSTKFSLLSNHVVFTFSGDEEAAKRMMRDVFNVETPAELGGGINMSNFARFAEVKIALKFMDKFRKKYSDQKIMYLADTNLPFSNMYWPEILKSFSGASLLVDQPTTVSPQRFSSDGKETNGVANAYDHFVLDKNVFSSCSNGEVYNYYNSAIDKDVQRIYGMRATDAFNPGLRVKGFLPVDEGGQGGDVPPEDQPLPTKLDYPLSSTAQNKMTKMVNSYVESLKTNLTVKKNEVVFDDFAVTERTEGYQRRVFLNQLTNAFYYRFYQEILSDHFPVSITCKF